MRLASLSLLVGSIAVQQTAATYANLWGPTCPTFQSNRTPKECTNSMESGWKWEGIVAGFEVLDAYAGFYVSGLQVRDNCKNPHIDDSASKCAVAELEKVEAGVSIALTDVEAIPSGFSVSSIHLSASISAELEFVYVMTDGSTCKHNANASIDYSVIENTQCAGAVLANFNVVEAVTVEVFIYSINWACGGKGGNGGTPSSLQSIPAAYPTGFYPNASSTTTPLSSTVYFPTGNFPTGHLPTGVFPPSPPPRKSSSSHGSVTTPQYVPTLPIGTPPALTPTTVPSNQPGGGPPIGTPGVPSVASSASGVSSNFPPFSTPIPSGNLPPPSAPTGPPGPPGVIVPGKPPGGAPNKCQPSPDICPPVVPKCLATWLTVTKCATNTDSDCYCQHFEYTKLVIDCINARGCSKLEIDIGMSYFVGICAKHIPKNPGIITNLPPKTNLSSPPKIEVPATGGGNSPPQAQNGPPASLSPNAGGGNSPPQAQNGPPASLSPNAGGGNSPPQAQNGPPASLSPNAGGGNSPPQAQNGPPASLSPNAGGGNGQPPAVQPPKENNPVPLIPSAGGNILPPNQNPPPLPPPVIEHSPPNEINPSPPNAGGNTYPPGTHNEGPPSPYVCPPEVESCPFASVITTPVSTPAATSIATLSGSSSPVPTLPVTIISIVKTVEIPITSQTNFPTTPSAPTPTSPVFVSEIITVPQVRFNIITISGPSGPIVETGLVPGPPPASTPVGTPVTFGPQIGTGAPTGFRPIVNPTQPTSASPTPPAYTGAANANKGAGQIVGGVAGGLAALLLL